MNFNVTLNTDGRGLWNNVERAVRCVSLSVPYIDEEEDFGELCVYFDPETWNIREDGLIYTDNKFLNELRRELDRLGLDGLDVEYSEQGMQTDEYVSLDVGGDFIASWKSLARVAA